MNKINSVAVVIVSKSKSAFKGSIIGLKCVGTLKEANKEYIVDFYPVMVLPTATQADIKANIKDTLGHLRKKPQLGFIVSDGYGGVEHTSKEFVDLNEIISKELETFVTGEQRTMAYTAERDLCSIG